MSDRNYELFHMINILHKAWRLHPEQRLCQLIENVSGKRRQDYISEDLFYVADEMFLRDLKAFIQKWEK